MKKDQKPLRAVARVLRRWLYQDEVSAKPGRSIHFFSVSLGFILMGCTTTVSDDVSRDAGQMIFADNCVECHGADAKGDGPWAKNLKTQPADLTKIASRRNGVWPMLEVMSIIDGYSKKTIPREEMPIIIGLSEGPMVDFDTGNGLVEPTPARLVAIAIYLESIQSPTPRQYVP
ncbi:cytochrome c [Roseovarius rhodophyticola]|uniref:Cytochrome c n=1 Tax=Roseovarius rhodophyticola TaxID=3080827 RepID=A0ABZ2TIX3_9RHOB|nr:cytochrome c [Roseovarius sp. W115]MDV2928295.1 cytochrome c [Roseovarius sp. W115]